MLLTELRGLIPPFSYPAPTGFEDPPLERGRSAQLQAILLGEMAQSPFLLSLPGIHLKLLRIHPEVLFEQGCKVTRIVDSDRMCGFKDRQAA